MSDPADVLEQAIAALVAELVLLPEGLLAVVQFGSTVRPPLKRETDVDLLVALEHPPPGRTTRYALTEEPERRFEQRLRRELPADYHIIPSLKVVSREELLRFSLLYLDMVDHSRVWFDPEGLVAEVLRRTRSWIATSGAHRVDHGARWYWVLGDDVRWDREVTVGW